jgi:hypothetical protein
MDPRTCQAFYIGKGTGDRKQTHFKTIPKDLGGEPTTGRYRRIKEIQDAGFTPTATVIKYYGDEQEALAAELAMIEQIGIDNLTNQNLGGGGDKSTKGEVIQLELVEPKQRRVRKLTPKQERFCQALIDPEIPNASQAYRVAYKVRRMSNNAIAAEAWKLQDVTLNPHIAQRINELRAATASFQAGTLEECVSGFRDSAKLANDISNPAAMTGAYRELGKISDVYPKDEGIGGGDIIINNQTINLTKVEMARRVAHLMDGEVIDVED